LPFREKKISNKECTAIKYSDYYSREFFNAYNIFKHWQNIVSLGGCDFQNENKDVFI
jgi:hypothetical protein